MSEELLDCPFCGGIAEHQRTFNGTASVECQKCFASTFMAHKSYKEAAKSWNTRKPQEQGKLVELDENIFFDLLKGYHGGNPTSWLHTLEKLWKDHFSKFGVPAKPSECKHLGWKYSPPNGEVCENCGLWREGKPRLVLPSLEDMATLLWKEQDKLFPSIQKHWTFKDCNSVAQAILDHLKSLNEVE